MNIAEIVPKGQEVRLDSKGRVIVPCSIRRKLGLIEGKVFEVFLTNNDMLLLRLVS